VAVLPSVFFTLMVTNRAPMYQSSFQYAYQWFPYIVVASILALKGMRSAPFGEARQRAATIALAFVAVGAGFQYGVLLGGDTIIGGFGEKRVSVTPENRERYEKLKTVVAKIPPDASVTATDPEGPHVSTRLVLYNINYTLGERPDYILINDSIGGGVARRVLEVLERKEYGVLAKKRPFYLLRRGHTNDKDAELVAYLKSR
jgi:uncharacterized membrane protein